MDRVEVEVVRRLVEQQGLRMSEQGLSEQNPHLLPTLQLRHRPVVQPVGNVEPLQENGRVTFRRVSVLLADDALELAEAHAVLVADRGLLVQLLALLERRPEPGVAHDHRVDHAETIEDELILPQDAELGRPRDRALLRRKLAGQELQERRLARAVGSGQAIAPA